jgi:hypothetical protein
MKRHGLEDLPPATTRVRSQMSARKDTKEVTADA